MSDVNRVVELAKAELSGSIREVERKELAELVVRLLGPSIGRPSMSFELGHGATLTLTGKPGSEQLFGVIAAAIKAAIPSEVAGG